MSRKLMLVLAPLFIAGCLANPHERISEDWHENLKNPNADIRVEALKVMVETNDQGAIPLVIDRLEDEEPGVRMFAYHALRRICGEDLGFTPYGSEVARAAEVAKWRAWWAAKHPGAPAAPASPAAQVNPAPASEKKP